MRNLPVIAVVLLVGLSQGTSAQHVGGGSLAILGAAGDACNGNKVAPPFAILEDQSTGRFHRVQICALESVATPGTGSIQLMLSGGGLQVCTVNGGGGLELGQPVPTPNCGNAGGQTVRINGCQATISAHGSTHADDPHTPYIGGVTLDISFLRTVRGGGDGELTITVHTPKRQIQLKGKLMGALGGGSIGSAFVDMPTCNI